MHHHYISSTSIRLEQDVLSWYGCIEQILGCIDNFSRLNIFFFLVCYKKAVNYSYSSMAKPLLPLQ